MFRFNLKYFVIAVAIFLMEVLIALYIHDRIIRPYIGDLLVVILVYAMLRAFLTTSVLYTAAIALIFSYAVEFLQYLKIVDKLGLQKSRLARVIIGTSFSWTDILMYTIGILIVLVAERILSRSLNN